MAIKPCMTHKASARWLKLRRQVRNTHLPKKRRHAAYRAMKRMEKKAKPCFVV